MLDKSTLSSMQAILVLKDDLQIICVKFVERISQNVYTPIPCSYLAIHVTKVHFGFISSLMLFPEFYFH